MKHAIYKIEKLIEEATTGGGALEALAKNLKEKWDWSLTPEIKEKFTKRFSNIKRVGNYFEAYDKNKNRTVLLKPDLKSFVQVKETGNQCGFLRGAVQASKNLKNKIQSNKK